MADNKSSTSGGIGFTGALTITFIVLKLTHVIDWSWWWVLAPLWLGAALTVAIFIVIGIGVLIAAILKKR